MDNNEITAGSGVYNTDCLCPTFGPDNPNLFSNTFGIEFEDDNDHLVWPMSAFEFVSAFGLDKEMTYSLSHPANFSLMDSGVPQRTSIAILSALTDRLDSLRLEEFELHDPSLRHAPSALCQISAFLNGAVGTKLPDNRHWSKALQDDPETKLLMRIVSNPGLAEEVKHINSLHSIYRHPARLGNFSTKDGVLFMKEIFKHDSKYSNLRIVPLAMRNVVFVAFHANPIGGHYYSWAT